MKLIMGSQVFQDVQIPLLWGTRAIVQDEVGQLSVIDLAGEKAKLEILGDKPAPGITYIPIDDGYAILSGDERLYIYNPKEKRITGIALRLPECQIRPSETRVGTNIFSGNMIAGYSVGIVVTENGIAMGAQLPPGLAKLVV
jgi:hypothetical protein